MTSFGNVIVITTHVGIHHFMNFILTHLLHETMFGIVRDSNVAYSHEELNFSEPYPQQFLFE